MTYLGLARKWRPQTFSDLVGQEPIVRTLENAVTLNRVSHALLFTGSRGVGKTTTARIVAKALNCEKGPTIIPCGRCSNCLEIAAGNNIDVLEIDGASNTHVDDVRELIENVRYAPSKSKFKIYIIDEVHMLSKSAFNALLKTLEEPPPGVIFLFATTEPHKIPDTILSRCQRFDFLKISEHAMVERLREVIKTEKMQLKDACLRMVARQSEGSLRDALASLDRVAASTGKEISEDDVAAVLGLTDRELITRTLQAFVDHDVKSALSVLDDVLKKGFDPKSYLLDLWGKVRDLLVLKTGANENLVHSTPEEIERFKEWVSRLEEFELERWFELLRKTAQDVGRAEFPRYLLEVMFIRIARSEPQIPLTELIHRLEQLESRLKDSFVEPRSGTQHRTEQKATDSPPPDPVPPAGTASVAARPGLNWDTLISAVKRKKPAMAGILLQAVNPKVEPGKILLPYEEDSFYIARALEPDFQNRLAEIAGEIFGGTFSVVVTAEEKQERSSKSQVAVDRALEKEALEHPVIRKAVTMFNGTIEEIKPKG